MVEGRQEARFSQECHLNFIHAPMLPDMILRKIFKLYTTCRGERPFAPTT
ncbi:MAG: hypothetical protein F6K39_17000 [Okeania sp. SIO3B3]|nr:hypothetical protein [Okeania sp. SIO3B3]